VRLYLEKKLSPKKKKRRGGASGVAQGIGPEFRSQYHKIKNCKDVLTKHFIFVYDKYKRIHSLGAEIELSLLPQD
jgi:hypothetical protein